MRAERLLTTLLPEPRDEKVRQRLIAEAHTAILREARDHLRVPLPDTSAAADRFGLDLAHGPAVRGVAFAPLLTDRQCSSSP